MFETGVRQLRLAMSMVTGRPLNVRNVERLIGDALATLDVFGSPGDDLQEMLDGPFSDPQARRAFQEQALRRTARPSIVMFVAGERFSVMRAVAPGWGLMVTSPDFIAPENLP